MLFVKAAEIAIPIKDERAIGGDLGGILQKVGDEKKRYLARTLIESDFEKIPSRGFGKR